MKAILKTCPHCEGKSKLCSDDTIECANGHIFKYSSVRSQNIEQYNLRADRAQPPSAGCVRLGYEIIGEKLFFGEMRPDGSKLNDVWYVDDMTDYTKEARQKSINRAKYLAAAPQNNPASLYPKPEFLDPSRGDDGIGNAQPAAMSLHGDPDDDQVRGVE